MTAGMMIVVDLYKCIIAWLVSMGIIAGVMIVGSKERQGEFWSFFRCYCSLVGDAQFIVVGPSVCEAKAPLA